MSERTIQRGWGRPFSHGPKRIRVFFRVFSPGITQCCSPPIEGFWTVRLTRLTFRRSDCCCRRWRAHKGFRIYYEYTNESWRKGSLHACIYKRIYTRRIWSWKKSGQTKKKDAEISGCSEYALFPENTESSMNLTSVFDHTTSRFCCCYFRYYDTD